MFKAGNPLRLSCLLTQHLSHKQRLFRKKNRTANKAAKWPRDYTRKINGGVRNAEYGRFVTGNFALYYKQPITMLKKA